MKISIFAGIEEEDKFVQNLQATQEKFLPNYGLALVPLQGNDAHILNADNYVDDDTTHIMHVANDSIFTDELSDDLIFKDDKIIMPYTPFDTLLSQELPDGMHELLVKSRQGVSELLDIEIEHEFARRLPITYPIELYKECRSYVEDVQKMTLDDAIHVYDVSSVYNLLGAYAWQNNKDAFHWLNTDEDELENLPFMQSTKDKDFIIII